MGGDSPPPGSTTRRRPTRALTCRPFARTECAPPLGWLANAERGPVPLAERMASPLFATWRDRRRLAQRDAPARIVNPRKTAGARTRVLARPPGYAPSARCGLPPLRHGAVELFAGLGTMSAAWQHHGFTVVAVAEKIASKQLSLRRRFKKARVLQDATEVTRESVGLEAVSSVFGGIPCQPIARAGGARGIDDDRIADTTDALPAAALALGADSADAENHADLVSISNGAVLDRLNANFGAAFSLADVSYVNCAAANAPEERNRVALRWETTSMLASIGPCPPLSLIRWPRLRICDIMLPLHDVADDQWVAGRVVVRPPSPATPGKAQPVADLHISADDPIRRGSLVRRSGSLFTVAALDEAAGTAKLFRDVRRAEAYFDDVPVAELTHVAQSCTLLSTSSIASAFTRFGVGLTKNRKQLWLRSGRAYLPSDLELTRLHELCDAFGQDYVDASNGSPSPSLGEAAGDGTSMRMAEAQAARASLRRRLLDNFELAQSALRSSSLSAFQRSAVRALSSVAPWPGVGTFMVFLRVPASGAPQALVGADLVSLPLLERYTDQRGARQSAISAASSFLSKLGDGFVPVLACDDSDARVVACPLPAHCGADADACPGLAWRDLASVADTCVYDLVAAAVAQCATFANRAIAGGVSTAVRGARGLRPFARSAPAPALCPAAWPRQLQFSEAVDCQLRRMLASPRVALGAGLSAAHAAYLQEWADRVDPSHVATLPVGLRGHVPNFGDSRLLTQPFPHVDGGVPETVFVAARDCPQAQPHTEYRPRNIVPDIISRAAASRLIRELRAALADLASMANPTSDEFRRTAKAVVVTQSEFHPDARGIVWDTSRVLFDEDGPYFAPADFNAELSTHLDTDALFDALGPAFPDQQLRHMLRTGIVFVPGPSLDMVVCPHLLSLARGFDRVDGELARLATAGYVEYVSALDAHIASLDDDSFLLSFGRIPCVCASQGTVERTLEPGRPRRIEDAGQPRRPLRSVDDVLVPSLNDRMNVDDVDDAGDRLVPWERKPTVAMAMAANCVLAFAAILWQEPVVSWGDDVKDYFNQIYLHPSQRHLSTILWRDPTSGDMTHILELSLGFGQRLSSNFANRLTFALVEVFAARVDALEAPLFDAETDPSRRDWIAARRRLSDVTGRNECRLFSILAYTDDFKVQVVGLARALRLMTVWYDMTRSFNLRMAIPAKRAAGTSTLWLGLRGFSTLGFEVIPPAKQSRALSMLQSIVELRGMQNDHYAQLRGLLQHLVPFSAGDCSMYDMHSPAAAHAHLGPAGWMRADDTLLSRVATWVRVLVSRPGVPALAALSRLECDEPTASDTTTLWEMSSDAAKDGTAEPGLAGYMHGASWYLPLLPSDVRGASELPIAALELAAVVVNFMVFGPRIPCGVRVVVMSDSLTLVDGVADGTAHAPLMQFLHKQLLALPDFGRLVALLLIGHLFGEGNVMSDARSRGYTDTITQLCANLHIKHVPLDVPQAAHDLMTALRAEHARLADGAPLRDLPLPPPPLRRSSRLRSLPVPGRPPAHSDGPVGNGVCIGQASNPGPVPTPPSRRASPTPPVGAAPRSARSPSPTPGAPAAHRAPSPTPAALTVPKRPRFCPSPVVTSSLTPAPTPPGCSRSPRSASPRDFSGAPIAQGAGAAPLSRPAPLRVSLAAPTPRSASSPPTGRPPRSSSPRSAAPAPAAHTAAVPVETSAASHSSSLISMLESDTSPWALHPSDPTLIPRLVAAVSSAVDSAVPVRSLKRDARRFASWKQHCRELGTDHWRGDVRALSGEDPVGFARENFLLASYAVRRYRELVPRSRRDAAAKPQSVRPYIDTVRNAHKRRGITLPPSSVVTNVLRGLLREYVRVHGSDALIPSRKEPIENAHVVSMYAHVRSASAGVNVTRSVTVSHGGVRFLCFRALLNALRQTGARKGDMIPVTAAEFDLSCVRRSNARWLIGGKIYRDPPPELLRSLKAGDRLLFKPASSKADQLSLTFGDKDIPINYHDDELNFAFALAALELAVPVRGDARSTAPMFTFDASLASLGHADADAIFKTLARLALGDEVAGTLSLHGGRIFLAVALRAQDYSTDMIKAFVRWRSDASAALYGRVMQDDHAKAIDAAMVAAITPTLIATSRREDVLDNDDAVLRAQSALSGSAARARHAASPSGPPSRTAAAADDGSGSSDDASGDSDGADDGVVAAGAPLLDSEVVLRAHVAVRFNAPRGGVKAYGGTITKVMPRHVRVSFPDVDGTSSTYDVKRECLLAVVG